MWFGDEARVGQKNPLTRLWARTGSRPTAPKDLRFAAAYIFGAVCPQQRTAAALVMPVCNTAAMNHLLQEIGTQLAADAHAVLITDGAAWHRSGQLVVPDSITIILLPPYSPELNPAERIWHFLRSHWLSSRVFADLDDVIGACVDAWNRFVADPDLIASLCHVAWAIPPEPSG